MRRTIAAPRDAVFRAWTDSDLFARWFGAREGPVPRVDLDARVGGRYRLEFASREGTAYLSGEYLEVRRPERLVFTFCWDGLPNEIADTRVSVDLYEHGGDTEVVVTHERQPSHEVGEFHRWGWTESFDRLAELLERPAAGPR